MTYLTPTHSLAVQTLCSWLLLQVLMASGLSLAWGSTSATYLLWWLASGASARVAFVHLRRGCGTRLADLFALSYCAFAGGFLGAHLKSWICLLFSLFC
jgi:hypothetical protein